MSSDEYPTTRASSNHRSAAADVSFATVAEDQHGESSSQAESRSSLQARKESSAANQEDSRHRIRRSGGFLLESIFANGKPKSGGIAGKHGKRRAQDGQLHVKKRPARQSQLSGESSLGSSPLSREVSIDEGGHDGSHDFNRPRPPSMDPVQLVHMALTLSESRKRHTSNTLHVPVPVSHAGSRTTSGAGIQYGTIRLRSSGRSRISGISDVSHRETPSSTHSDRAEDLSPSDEPSEALDDTLYTFSSATLSRADKARRYFELASQHRRLLQLLPPLKPDDTAPGNYTFQTESSPGFAQPHISRLRSKTNSKYDIGREYNPIQALRNRRLRNRQRRPLAIPTESWQDPQSISEWLDEVQLEAEKPGFRGAQDTVALPPFVGESIRDSPADTTTVQRHRRTGTVSSAPQRLVNDWSIDPTELLADTYWTEQDKNKAIIEDRRNRPIFPGRAKQSIDLARKSVESNRSVEPVEGGNEDLEESSKHGPKHRHHLSLLGAERSRRNRLAPLSRSASASSESSDGNRQRRRIDGDEDIGPLERHMNEMIARDERGELSPQELISPDHWDSKNTPFPNRRGRGESPKAQLAQHAIENLSIHTNFQHRRAKSADGRFGSMAQGRPLVEEPDSSPSSPVVASNMPSLAMDLTPPASKRTSLEKKRKSRRLPMLRSKSKERENIEQTDFAGTQNDSSRESSSQMIDPTRLSIDSARPLEFRRHRTAESLIGSLHRTNMDRTTTTKDGSIKEPSSTVSRFFKGGRLGELVRSEGSRLGDRFRSRERPGDNSDISAAVSEASDTDDDDKDVALTDDTDASPRTSLEQVRSMPRYNIPNLPSFKSPSGQAKRNSILKTPDYDPIGRQQAAQREAGRSLRFQRLAPPRINLPDEEDASDAGGPNEQSGAFNERRKSYGFLAPMSRSAARNSNVSLDQSGARSRNDNQMPMTGLSKLGSQGQRHWSISDRTQPQQADKLTMRDIARVRALLLASGVKAREIQRRADKPADTPTPYLVKAAEDTGEDVRKVLRKEEHLVASRLLSKNISSILSTFEALLSHFQSETAKSLHAQLDHLRSKAADELTKIVHETSDEADAFTVQLTTQQTLSTKQVDEAVDAMYRRRRRQFRLFRRAGFKLLEWTVLGVMWWLWFIVIMFKAGRRFVVALFSLLRWLLWF